jgi:raffinose/stachyose/melibiose transport system substrate-binding protein
MRKRGIAAVAIATAAAIALAGCSGGGAGDDSGKVTIEWWNIQTQEPTKTVWQDVADAYMADHPNVTVEITVQDDAAFKTALDARLQAGDPPDLFQTWGGGVLANQVDAGLVKDITSDVAPWIGTLSEAAASVGQVNGAQYAVPYDAGLVGFWYNKALFAAAGIDAPPATWPEFVDDVAALKASGVIPIALGAGDKWPAMFWWAQLALGEGGQKALSDAGTDGSFDSAPFISAGEKIVDLVDAGAFQEGFLGATYGDATGQASLVANGQAAMELMGTWAPGTQAGLAANGTGLGDDLGWFQFPTIPGGSGSADEGFGGVNSFAVGINAPVETLDFLEYISTLDVQKQIGAAGLLLPVAIGAEDSVTNPYMQAILQRLGEMKSVQSFLDQAYAPAVASAINDNVQTIFAKTQTPEQAAAAIAAVAKQ